MYITGMYFDYLSYTGTRHICWVHTYIYKEFTYSLCSSYVHLLYMSVQLVSSCVCTIPKRFEKISRWLGFEPWTSCTLQGCSDHCATSVTTLTYWIYFNGIRLLKSWCGLTWSLVSNVRRRPPPAPAMPSPGRAAIWISRPWHSNLKALLGSCNKAVPDWEIGSGWRVGQCSSSGLCHSRTVGPGRLAWILSGPVGN